MFESSSFFTAPNKKEQCFGEKQPNFVNFSGGEVRDENAILEKQNMKLEKDAMLRTPRDAVAVATDRKARNLEEHNEMLSDAVSKLETVGASFES